LTFVRKSTLAVFRAVAQLWIVRLHSIFDFMTLQALSKLSKKMKIAAGAVQILFGLFGISFGIYLVDGHPKVILVCSFLWLVSLYCCGVGTKLIYEARRAA
jgi:hypothetical protein